jgi:hypothetical protein
MEIIHRLLVLITVIMFLEVMKSVSGWLFYRVNQKYLFIFWKKVYVPSATHSRYTESDHSACLSYLRVKAMCVCIYIYIYRVIKKSLCTWWLQYRKLQVMFKVSPASLHTFLDTPNCVLEDRVHYSTVHIPNVFSDSHLQLISCVGIFVL